MKIGIYQVCKRCGGQFPEVAGADYSDGLCSVECLNAENQEEDAASNEVQWGYNHPECLDSAEDFAGDDL